MTARQVGEEAGCKSSSGRKVRVNAVGHSGKATRHGAISSHSKRWDAARTPNSKEKTRQAYSLAGEHTKQPRKACLPSVQARRGRIMSTIRRRTVSPAEFAKVFDIDVQRVYRWCQAGRLACMPKRAGSRERWKIVATEIDRVEREGFPEDPRNAERRAA